jgi:hypothetical protein
MAALNASKADLNGSGRVEIPAKLLKLLLQIALVTSEFDEKRYLAENPDVAKAIELGEIESAHMHYVGYGYFEGRLGCGPVVNENWYLAKYPDVGSAVREGKIKSAAHHFHLVGAAEGRSPNAEQEEDAAHWKLVFRK